MYKNGQGDEQNQTDQPYCDFPGARGMNGLAAFP